MAMSSQILNIQEEPFDPNLLQIVARDGETFFMYKGTKYIYDPLLYHHHTLTVQRVTHLRDFYQYLLDRNWAGYKQREMTYLTNWIQGKTEGLKVREIYYRLTEGYPNLYKTRWYD